MTNFRTVLLAATLGSACMAAAPAPDDPDSAVATTTEKIVLGHVAKWEISRGATQGLRGYFCAMTTDAVGGVGRVEISAFSATPERTYVKLTVSGVLGSNPPSDLTPGALTLTFSDQSGDLIGTFPAFAAGTDAISIISVLGFSLAAVTDSNHLQVRAAPGNSYEIDARGMPQAFRQILSCV
jgi:hypothetical protein